MRDRKIENIHVCFLSVALILGGFCLDRMVINTLSNLHQIYYGLFVKCL